MLCDEWHLFLKFISQQPSDFAFKFHLSEARQRGEGGGSGHISSPVSPPMCRNSSQNNRVKTGVRLKRETLCWRSDKQWLSSESCGGIKQKQLLLYQEGTWCVPMRPGWSYENQPDWSYWIDECWEEQEQQLKHKDGGSAIMTRNIHYYCLLYFRLHVF